MSAPPSLRTGKGAGLAGVAGRASQAASLERASLTTRILVLAVLAAAIPVPILWLLTASGARQASHEATA